ncbi:MAG: glycine cleavage system protein GcvH [Deltaproteobacteria bacterium]|jgi:glycine cleavage system H protein|nr:glycine cleavage system protein GcvH [Deltaproteobacteria bacterium]
MGTFSENMFFSREHMWVSVEDDIATIGITDYAQGQIGEVLGIDMMDVGFSIERDEAFGSLENARGVVDLVAPVTGEIVSVNEDLFDDIGILNSDPHEAGWIVVIEMKDKGELSELLTAEEYNEFLMEEMGIG